MPYRRAMSVEHAPPIVHELHLRCPADHAFDTYTRRFGAWWDPRYTANAETLQTIIIEPRVGGRIRATYGDIGDHDWGEVTVWAPGQRLVHTFTLAQDPDFPSEITVEFRPGETEGSCAVRFAHGGWTAENAATRAKFRDWPILLDRFAALAESRGTR
ncbi:Glyoxalase/Bleomycin resistance protein/dioxygenase domain protein [Minicystis rosea]|nr:Glyoxalase/Bleomycin resistance protein/dioxygenase domain protein [Minicystis rosea]